MQADYWDSTIILGDAGEETTAAATPADAADLSRHISHALLLPQGRPGGWLVFLLALCVFVVIHALHVQFS